jgi:hypothetical protein
LIRYCLEEAYQQLRVNSAHQSIPAGFPPICSLYRRDSRRYPVYIGGIPAGIQSISSGIKINPADHPQDSKLGFRKAVAIL